MLACTYEAPDKDAVPEAEASPAGQVRTCISAVASMQARTGSHDAFMPVHSVRVASSRPLCSGHTAVWLGRAAHPRREPPVQSHPPSVKHYNEACMVQASTVLQQFHEDLSARLWFSYRTGFAPLGEDHLTSDVGWGCTLRSCQMLLAQVRSTVRHACGETLVVPGVLIARKGFQLPRQLQLLTQKARLLTCIRCRAGAADASRGPRCARLRSGHGRA